MIDIIYKNKNIIVVNKPHGMPAQKDLSEDADAMTVTSEYLTELKENGKLWPVHRLDRVVGGALVFARSARMAAYLSEAIRERRICKDYLAVIEGRVNEGVLENLIYKDAKQGKAFIVDRERSGVKIAKLKYRAIATVDTEKGERTLVKVSLDTGRFHQIRAQFSHIGMPILGDGKYGSHEKLSFGIALFSAHLSIETDEKRVDAHVLPDTSVYPWSLFYIDEKDLL